MATVEDKTRLLKDIDANFELVFDHMHEEYVIFHNGGHFQTIPYGAFDKDVLDHIRKVVYINKNGDMAKHIDENNEKVVREQEKRTDAIIEQTAKDLYKPIRDAFN